MTWSPAPRHTVRGLFIGGRSVLHDNEGPGLNALDTGGNRVAAGNVRWRYTPSPSVAVSQQVYAVTAGYANRTPAGAIRQEGSDRDVVWRGAFEWTHARGRLEGGGQTQRVEASRRSQQFTLSGPITTLDTSGRSTNAAAWLHTSWIVAPGLVLSPGARVDRWGMIGATATTPWLLAEWQMTPTTRWRGGFSAPQQSPLVDQAALTNAGTTLEPERARTWDIGLERSIGTAWRAGVQVYHRQEHDLLRLVGSEPFVAEGAIVRPTQPYWENALTGHARGAGVRVERRTSNGLSGWIAYSWDRVTLTDGARGETFPGDYDQRHTFNAYGIYRWSGRTAISTRWRIGSNFPMPGYYQEVGNGYTLATERNQVRLPLYSRLDIRADRAFTFRGSRLTLFVEVLNLTNQSNVGPGDPDINIVTGRVQGLVDELFPLLPSAGLIIEF
jgi:hypothetical protein